MTWSFDEDRDAEISQQESEEDASLDGAAEYLIGTVLPGRRSLRADIRQALRLRDETYRDAVCSLAHWYREVGVSAADARPEVREAWKRWSEANGRVQELLDLV